MRSMRSRRGQPHPGRSGRTLPDGVYDDHGAGSGSAGCSVGAAAAEGSPVAAAYAVWYGSPETVGKPPGGPADGVGGGEPAGTVTPYSRIVIRKGFADRLNRRC